MGRRSRGEGTIYKQADGLWAAAITVNGKRIVKRAKKQEEVRRWLVETRNKAEMGTLAPEGHRQTLSACLERWLETLKPTVRPKTYSLYEYPVRVHVTPALGKYRLAQLRPDHLQGFYADKLQSGFSRRTVQLCHVVLHKSLKQATSWGLISRNVANAVEPPRPGHTEHKVWATDQARTFLAAVRGDRLEALFVLALSTGIRRGELLGLKWEDVDLGRGTLQVRRTVGRVHKGGVQVREPKSAAGRRQVLLSRQSV